MRKRTIKYCFDTLLWGVITFLPLILYLVFIIGTLFGHRDIPLLNQYLDAAYTSNVPVLGFFTVMSDLFGWFSDFTLVNNTIYTAIESVFNSSTLILDGTELSFICYFALWIINVQLLHIAVDFILILPRICRKFLDKFKSEDC